MKQIIPFTKDIVFKSSIGDLKSISLDHDLQLKGEDLVTGNFYIKGKYKLTKASQLEEDFSYKIPCEIAISDDYDTFDATIDIDDFYYDVVDDDVLRVNISVCIDNLNKKTKVKEVVVEKEKKPIEERLEENIIFNYDNEERDVINPVEIIQETKKEVFDNIDTSDTFSTYFVYSIQENDTFDKIIEKYHCRKEDILLYNDITDLIPGTKLVIPETNNE